MPLSGLMKPYLVPLLSKGHTTSADAQGWLHQLQIHKLLQHKDMVVCLEGLNGKLESLQSTFQVVPLWNTATPSKPADKPQLIEVDLGNVQPESMTTDIPVPPTALVLTPSLANTVEPPSDTATAINLHLHRALEWLKQASLTASAPIPQCSMPRRKLPLVALEASPSTGETEDLRPEGTDSAIPALMATLTQMSLWVAMLGDTPSFGHVTYPLLQPTMPKTLEAASMCTFPPGLSQPDCKISYFLYRRK